MRVTMPNRSSSLLKDQHESKEGRYCDPAYRLHFLAGWVLYWLVLANALEPLRRVEVARPLLCSDGKVHDVALRRHAKLLGAASRNRPHIAPRPFRRPALCPAL
jgi:hypothetical protein